MYVAIVNVPGYMPMSDDPPTFDTAADAWDYLYKDRFDELDFYNSYEFDSSDPHDSTLDEMMGYIDDNDPGTVYGTTPGYHNDDYLDGGPDHDLGLAYSVTYVNDDGPCCAGD